MLPTVGNCIIQREANNKIKQRQPVGVFGAERAYSQNHSRSKGELGWKYARGHVLLCDCVRVDGARKTCSLVASKVSTFLRQTWAEKREIRASRSLVFGRRALSAALQYTETAVRGKQITRALVEMAVFCCWVFLLGIESDWCFWLRKCETNIVDHNHFLVIILLNFQQWKRHFKLKLCLNI